MEKDHTLWKFCVIKNNHKKINHTLVGALNTKGQGSQNLVILKFFTMYDCWSMIMLSTIVNWGLQTCLRRVPVRLSYHNWWETVVTFFHNIPFICAKQWQTLSPNHPSISPFVMVAPHTSVHYWGWTHWFGLVFCLRILWEIPTSASSCSTVSVIRQQGIEV